MVAPIFEAPVTRQYASGNATSGTVAAPSGIQAGDLILLFVYTEGASNSNVTASGFTRIANPAATDHSQAALWKIAGSSEPSSYTASWPNSDWWELTAVRVAGASTTNPIDAVQFAVRTTTNANTAPNVTLATTGPDRLLVWSATNFNGGTWTQPTGWANRNTGNQLMGTASLVQASAATVTSTGALCSANGQSTAIVVAINPAGAPTVDGTASAPLGGLTATATGTGGSGGGGATGHPSVVQGGEVISPSGTSPINATSSSGSLPAAATAGNALALVLAGDKNTGAITVADNGPNGGTWQVDNIDAVALTSASVSLYIAWKVATGGEQNFTVTHSVAAQGCTGYVLEMQQDGTAGWGVVARATTLTDETAVASVGTGTTGAATYNGLAVAAAAVDSIVSLTVPAEPWSNSYTARYNAPTGGVTGSGGGSGGAYVATALVDQAATTSSTFQPTSGSDQMSGAVLVLGRQGVGSSAPAAAAALGGLTASATAGAVTRTLQQAWLGVDTITVKTSTTVPADQVRIAFSTSSAMTSPVYSTGGTMAPDTNGVSKHTIPALAADTNHWYQVELGGQLVGSPQQFQTLPAAGQQASFNLGFWSCRDHAANQPNPDPTGLADMMSRGVDLHYMLGDIHYRDIASNDVTLFRAGYDELFTRSNFVNILKAVPTAYIPSDHDTGGDNTDGADVALPAFQTAYRERVPHTTLPATSGVQHSFVVGRVRFIGLDTRSYRSPNANTDNSSKTMLGSAQKAWLKDLLDNATTPVTFIASDVGWIGAADSAQDHWGNYNTERQEIASWITANAAKTKVVFICGDAHMLAIDDGTNSAGGAPVYHAAELNQFTSTKVGPYSGGSRPSQNAYGRIAVADTGTQIALTYSGYYNGGTLWATHTTTAVLPSTIDGTATVALGGLTATATGTPTVTATAAAPLGALSSTAAGDVIPEEITATATAPLAGLVAAATGTVVPVGTGTADAPLGSLTATAAGVRDTAASATADLGGLVAAATGSAASGPQAVAPLGALVAAASATRTVLGGASAGLGPLTAAATGTRATTAGAVADLGGLTAHAAEETPTSGVEPGRFFLAV